MVNLPKILEKLRPGSVANIDWLVADNGEGQFIAKWDEAKLGPMPSNEDMEAVAVEVAREVLFRRLRSRSEEVQAKAEVEDPSGRIWEATQDTLDAISSKREFMANDSRTEIKWISEKWADTLAEPDLSAASKLVGSVIETIAERHIELLAEIEASSPEDFDAMMTKVVEFWPAGRQPTIQLEAQDSMWTWTLKKLGIK